MKDALELNVYRTFSDGSRVLMGHVASDGDEIWYRFDQNYLVEHPKGNPSPIRTPYTHKPILGPNRPNAGLHGFLADSLPDGWGLRLMDRVFENHGLDPMSVTPLERLAFIGNRATGALSFEPVHPAAALEENSLTEITELGQSAVSFYDSATDVVLRSVVESGSSAGARPKSMLWIRPDGKSASTQPIPDGEPWLIKFTSKHLPLGHEEGIWEAAALSAARAAGVRTQEWRLFDGPAAPEPQRWLGVRRFDRTTNGRLLFASTAGLLDADFRLPALDYSSLLRLTSVLTKSAADSAELVRRALFNFLIMNADDHAKNFGFLLSDEDEWRLSPAYDVTYSPGISGEHSTAFLGCGKHLTRDAVLKIAALASLGTAEMRTISEDVAAGAEQLVPAALALGAKKKTAERVKKALKENLARNAAALGL